MFVTTVSDSNTALSPLEILQTDTVIGFFIKRSPHSTTLHQEH